MAPTPGLKALEAAGIAVTLHPYAYDPGAEAVGLQAAEALGIDPGLMLKTLMVEVDGRPCVCVIPADRQLSMKKVAAALGGKAAAMMAVSKAEKLSGMKVGGISPFGQKRALPVLFEEGAMVAQKVWINAGQRGLLLGIAPGDALSATGGSTAPLVA